VVPEAMLCSPTRAIERSDGWVLQPKWDGWRMLVMPRPAGVSAFTRHGTAITDRLSPELRAALAALRSTGAVLDGELVCLGAGAAGPTADFAALGAALRSRDRAGAQLLYVAFDLLELGGENLRGRPWRDRDAQLRELVAEAGPTVTAINTLPVAAGVHDRVVELGFDGSVLKRINSGYRAGRSRAWLKHKARHLTSARVRAISVSEDRGRMALCDLEGGGRCWAPAHQAQTGDLVTVAYSRRDAGGDLREPRVLAAA
jgi:ATP-dependent DNA ligase